jgi:predicted DNA-binding protein (MmcQ/YjbR family)
MELDVLQQHLLAFPGAHQDFPFGPETLVTRVGGPTGKLFALLALDTTPPRINLKGLPQRNAELRAQWPEHILPGYHMSKAHWNTLVLDGHLPPALLRELIQHSYDLVRASLPKGVQEGL